MIQAQDIARQVEAVQDLLTAKFGIKRAALPKMLKRAGRRLPRGMHKRVQVLIEADKRAGHPKLSRQLDHAAVTQAVDAVTAHLAAIDVNARRKGFALGLAGVIAGNVLLVVAGFILWLWWRGFV